ncbi:MAG: ATP-binding protein [Cellulosilyticaceae bacterium]
MKKSIKYKILKFNIVLTLGSIIIVYSLFSIVIKHYLINELQVKLENDTKMVVKLLEKKVPYEDIKGIKQESKSNPVFKVIKGHLETNIVIMDLNKDTRAGNIFHIGQGPHLNEEQLRLLKENKIAMREPFEMTINNSKYLGVAYKINNKNNKNNSTYQASNMSPQLLNPQSITFKPASYETKENIQNDNEDEEIVIQDILDIKPKIKALSNVTVIGYIEFTSIDGFNRLLSYIMLWAIITVSVITFFMTWIFSRRITNPIKALVEFTHKVGNREFKDLPSIKTGDELQVLSQEFKEMTDKIALYDYKQKELFQDMAHEIKTPLMSISGYAEGIKDKIFEDEDQALKIIIDESERIRKLVENMIYLTRLETNAEECMTFTTINIVETMIMGIQKIESLAIEEDIDIIFQPEESIVLSADQEKMLRVFINILSNSIKYTKNIIEITITREEQRVIILIRDNGEGFSEEALTKLFDRFYKEEKEGTGIGMCIVKHIIERHKGKITVYNHEEGGAVFVIQLPL